MKVVLKVPKPSNKSWTVSGKTIRELFGNLNKHKWWGRYRSNPTYSVKEKDGKISEFTVKAAPVVTMPSWSNYSKASKDEKKSWDDMYKALDKHENNHHTIFTDACDEWVKAMDKMGDLDKKQAKSEWDSFNADTQKKQDAYDTKTSHGEKEGVILQDV